MNDKDIVIDEALRGGQMWSRVLRRGQRLRLTDIDGKASVSALFYNADSLSERYNMPDTLKAQQTAYLTQGFVLYSDMGRILCSVIEDTVGWHDTITGHSTRQSVEKRYGEGSYLKLRNNRFRNARDNFLTELGKHELTLRDIVPNVNFFVKVVADNDGNLAWVEQRRVGTYVELRAELNTLVVLSNTPHPLDPNPSYEPGSVQLTIRAGLPASLEDACRLSRPENGRGFILTETYFV